MNHLIDLREADRGSAGPKAAVLGHLLRSGFPVPLGFVIPTCVYAQVAHAAGLTSGSAAVEARSTMLAAPVAPGIQAQISEHLRRLTTLAGTPHVAVRSSATVEDLWGSAAAGQHETVLGVRDTESVLAAIRTTWGSLWSERAMAYRDDAAHPALGEPAMAVLVQTLVDAAVSGVLFTGGLTGNEARIEAVPGLGEPLVSGQVTPDSWLIANGRIMQRRAGDKRLRTDRGPSGMETTTVPPADRHRLSLTDDQVFLLAHLGRSIQDLLGEPQDIEWAITADGRPWILQSRPVTAELPRAVGAEATAVGAEAIAAGVKAAAAGDNTAPAVLVGLAASPGKAQGPVRTVRGLDDFPLVRPGDVLVCPTTDPAWTPLFRIAAAVVTERGGLLSHAAIVAREYGIPAVLAVPAATTTLGQGTPVQVDGDQGWVLPL